MKSKYERRFLHDFRETPAVPAGHNYSHDSLFPLSILIGPLHPLLEGGKHHSHLEIGVVMSPLPFGHGGLLLG